MTWLHEQEAYKTFVAIYCRTDLNKSDMNTKAHREQILQTKQLCLIGYRFYPPKGTTYCDFLVIGKYDIGIHRGSFLLEPANTVYKAKAKKKYL